MKLSNERIVNDAAKLGAIAEKQLPIKVSYAIAKNISKIECELKIYNKEKQKLVEKYAELDANGNVTDDGTGQIMFKEGCKDQWNKDIKELMAIENEVDIHKFKLDELNGQIMTPAEIMLIEYMIEE